MLTKDVAYEEARSIKMSALETQEIQNVKIEFQSTSTQKMIVVRIEIPYEEEPDLGGRA